VHAHPDDESLWTGGAIARYAARGVQVTVVTCTLGEEGEIIPAGLAELRAAAANQLGGYRVVELRSACAALGVTDHRFLGGIGRWRDSGMAGTPANHHPRALAAGDVDEQVAALREIVADVRPQVVVTYDADGGYGHPDHIRANRITVAACHGNSDVARVFHTVQARRAVDDGVAELRELVATGAELPFRLPERGELPAVRDDVITTVVDVAAHLPAKLRALRAHATQISVWDDGAGHTGYALSNGVAQPIAAAEYFVLAKGSTAGAERDLFGGLAVINVEAKLDPDGAFASGAVVGPGAS
jgi:N-acetyl-1-D-myo-inositol-2-amino-2-deoxy-alpha-D-glucopyranoside deacetylase